MQYTPTPMDSLEAERKRLESKYNASRINLLIVIAFTVINVILLVTESNYYFLFSAFIPYLIVDLGMLLCGKYPADYYTDELADMQFLDSSFLIVTVIIALVITAVYFLCWLLSRNVKSGWMITALVLFSVDTLSMFATVGLSFDFLIDLLFHAWVIVELSRGVYYASRYKSLNGAILPTPYAPEQAYQPYQQYQPIYPDQPSAETPTAEPLPTEQESESEPAYTQGIPFQYPDSPILRETDNTVKSRILLEAFSCGLNICYRRVKKVNELVINGKVYGEYTALIETAHSLRATVNGHFIEAGFDGLSHSYINFEGNQIAKKLRLY